MFSKIMVPVDLAHKDKLARCLTVSADLARHYGAGLTYVGVTGNTPGPVAHTAEEFGQKLAAFATEQGEALGLKTDAKSVVSHDPAAELNKLLVRTAHDLSADLIVMASHVPGAADYLFHGHGAHVAAHADLSVMLVREA